MVVASRVTSPVVPTGAGSTVPAGSSGDGDVVVDDTSAGDRETVVVHVGEADAELATVRLDRGLVAGDHLLGREVRLKDVLRSGHESAVCAGDPGADGRLLPARGDERADAHSVSRSREDLIVIDGGDLAWSADGRLSPAHDRTGGDQVAGLAVELVEGD
jgi:hypothetical protein